MNKTILLLCLLIAVVLATAVNFAEARKVDVTQSCLAECKHHPALKMPQCMRDCNKRPRRPLSDNVIQTKKSMKLPAKRIKKEDTFYALPYQTSSENGYVGCIQTCDNKVFNCRQLCKKMSKRRVL